MLLLLATGITATPAPTAAAAAAPAPTAATVRAWVRVGVRLGMDAHGADPAADSVLYIACAADSMLYIAFADLFSLSAMI